MSALQPYERPIVRIAAIALPAIQVRQIEKNLYNQRIAETDVSGELLNSCNRCPDWDTGRPPVDTESLEHEAPMIPIAMRDCISAACCRDFLRKPRRVSLSPHDIALMSSAVAQRLGVFRPAPEPLAHRGRRYYRQ